MGITQTGTFDIFDAIYPEYKSKKKVRLIEFFGGIGSQAKALERLGVDFEAYKLCEIDKYAVQTYNSIHGTSFVTSDISEVHADNLDCVAGDEYDYILTYSYPCTSLSVSGKREGMKEGSGTASSLIWEVKRILKEMSDLAKEKAANSNGQVYCLPKILLMENVPQVIDAMNVGDLNRMRDFLESLGYSNHLAIMRGNDYGVPQARHRAFMVSVLGDEENPVYSYNFPVPCGCTWSIRDCMLDKFETKLYERTSVTHAICENAASFNRSKSNVNAIKLCGRVNSHQGGRVIDEYGVSVTLTAGGSGEVRVLTRKPTDQVDSTDWEQFVGQEDFADFSELESLEEVSDFFFNPEVSENDYSKEDNFKWDAVVRDGYEYSVRKFMPEETYLIMDFDLEDARRAKLCTSNAQMYKQAGNSIVVNCLVAILGQFFEGKEQVYCDVAKVKPTERSNFKS